MINPYQPYPARITDIVIETPDKLTRSYRIGFVRQEDRARFKFEPGQFAQLSLAGAGEIPIGIASSPLEEGDLLFTVRRAGRVTSRLHSLMTGDPIGIRGPYGKPFPWDSMKGATVVLLGGGFGFTTLRSALAYMLSPDCRSEFRDIHVVYGARNPEQLLYKDQLNAWHKRDDIRLSVTVDDPGTAAWTHRIGFVPQVAKEVLPKGTHDTIALVCGPQLMIKFSVLALREMGYNPTRIALSLENRMKCGIGVCGRCNVGKEYVCVDGPVFTLADLAEMPDDL